MMFKGSLIAIDQHNCEEKPQPTMTNFKHAYSVAEASGSMGILLFATLDAP